MHHAHSLEEWLHKSSEEYPRDITGQSAEQKYQFEHGLEEPHDDKVAEGE